MFNDAVVTLTGTGLLDGFAGQASGLAGFTNFNSLVGGTGTDTLHGSTTNSTWQVTGSNALNYISGNTLAVSGFEEFIGHSIADTLSFAVFDTTRNIKITNAGSLDGFDLFEATFTGIFHNVNTVTGGTGADQLNGINQPLTWTLNGISN